MIRAAIVHSKVTSVLFILMCFANLSWAETTANPLAWRINEPVYDLSQKRPYKIGFSTSVSLQEVKLSLLSGDNDVVRVLVLNDLSPGEHEFQWLGVDEDGITVPDEVYVPVLSAKTQDGNKLVLDSRTYSGGAQIEGLQTKITGDGKISYVLDKAARVLIRAGMKGGPLMNTILPWEPRPTGANLQAWNGYDVTKTQYLKGHPDLRVLVIAYSLPDAAIITMGNPAQDYVEYRQSKSWKQSTVNPEQMISFRDGQRISPYYFLPRSLAYEPKVLFSLKSQHEVNEKGHWIADKPVLVAINLSKEDEWLMQQSQYEISFFVDHKFVAEEETGYTPLTWQWDPAGLTPGEYVFTVNVSGLWGHVGVYNALFVVPAKNDT